MVWAYNEAHLAWLGRFVAADLRERGDDVGNGTMAARLPASMKSAKNRAVVSKAIARLQAGLDAGEAGAPG